MDGRDRLRTGRCVAATANVQSPLRLREVPACHRAGVILPGADRTRPDDAGAVLVGDDELSPVGRERGGAPRAGIAGECGPDLLKCVRPPELHQAGF